MILARIGPEYAVSARRLGRAAHYPFLKEGHAQDWTKDRFESVDERAEIQKVYLGGDEPTIIAANGICHQHDAEPAMLISRHAFV